MERVKETLLGPSALTCRQAWITFIICCTFVTYIPGLGFLNTISQCQDTDYLNTYFFTFYGIAYVFGCILNAIIIDKIGCKSSLIFFGVTLSISTFSFAMIQKTSNTHFMQLNYIILAINAISCSAILPCIGKFIYTYYYPSQYDIIFIVIALCGHISSLSIKFGISKLMETSSNVLLNITYMSIFGVIIFSILSMIIKKDKDIKWFLSPVTVYDFVRNKYDKEFCKRQIMLNTERKNKHNSVRYKSDSSYDEKDDMNSMDDMHEEDTNYLEFQNRQLRIEMDLYSKNKPKLMRSNAFIEIYLLIIVSMCLLSLMNCLNVFSFDILRKELPSVYYHYHSKYEISSINAITLTLQIGMILSLILALFYRYHSNQSIYGQYKCSSVLVKLSIVISFVLCIIIWLIEYSFFNPGTASTAILFFDILFILYGVCISYPIHVFCYVYLLTISGYNAGLLFSILNLFMFLTSILYSIAVAYVHNFIGWEYISLLFILISIATAYVYTKLNNTQSELNILQTRMLLKIMQKNKYIKSKYDSHSFWYNTDADSSTDDYKVQLN